MVPLISAKLSSAEGRSEALTMGTPSQRHRFLYGYLSLNTMMYDVYASTGSLAATCRVLRLLVRPQVHPNACGSSHWDLWRT